MRQRSARATNMQRLVVSEMTDAFFHEVCFRAEFPERLCRMSRQSYEKRAWACVVSFSRFHEKAEHGSQQDC